MQQQDKKIIQVVDFFSGCGGMSYGFASANNSRLKFEIKGAVEINKHANATYRRMLGVDPHEVDIRELTSPERLNQAVLDWGLDRTKPLLLIGCSPCQGFSSHRKKDSRIDTRNTLLESFGKIVVQLLPDIIVMENVPEMLQDRHWEYFEEWKNIVEQAGYKIRVQIHNLAQFGVPQERFRALVIAARDWRFFSMPQPLLQPEEFVTVRDAIENLPPLEPGVVNITDPMHITSRHRPETIELLRMIPPDGGSRSSLPEGVGLDCHRKVDGFRDVYGRLWWDRPAVAITARCRTPSCGRFTHPEQHRGLSVREAALLQGFPANYYFEGPFDDKYKQIGNAVSPIFAREVANHIADEWFQDHNLPSRESDLEDDITSPLGKSFSSSIASIKRRLREKNKQELINV